MLERGIERGAIDAGLPAGNDFHGGTRSPSALVILLSSFRHGESSTGEADPPDVKRDFRNRRALKVRNVSTRDLFNEQRDRRFVAIVDCQIDRILAELRQLQLVDHQNQTGSDARFARRKLNLRVRIQRGHDRFAVRIDKGNPDPFLPFLDFVIAQFDGQGALRMGHGRFLGSETIERAENVEFATGIGGGGIAQGKNFNFH